MSRYNGKNGREDLFMLKKKMLVLLALIALLVLGVVCAQAQVERNGLLDSAFSMLEKDNIFVTRYNEITGADVQPLFETGMPYFFGGKDYERSMARYPEFTKRKCWETTTFYRKNTVYIEGFDCAGYASWVRMDNGLSDLPSLNDLLYKWGNWGKYYLWNNNSKYNKPMPAMEEIKDEARVGDILVIHARGNHILMYIGTLRDYGFTEEEVPALKDYMDYPLMIHCGVSPVYGARIQALIDADTTGYFSNVATTNGGVQISIWGVPRDAAEVHETVQGTDHDWFLLGEGQQVMTIYDLTNVSAWRWLRIPE